MNNNIISLSTWVDNLNEYILNRKDYTLKRNIDTLTGTLELLTIYQQYLKYINSNDILFYNILKLVDVLNSKNIDTSFYNHWISYFISCGNAEWISLWKTVKNVFENNNLGDDIMNFSFEPNRIFYQEGDKLLAEITFPQVQDGVFCINHTFVDNSLRGKGVAKKLVELAVHQIELNGGKVTATCSYAQNWLDKNKN